MIKKNEEKFELMSYELELLKTCSSDASFFQRCITRTLPLIKKIFDENVCEWEADIFADNEVIEANKELTEVFYSIREIACRKNDRYLKRQLVYLLRIIRGPQFKFGQPLIRTVYSPLKELYIKVLIQEKFPLLNKTQKIIKFENVWRKHYQNWHRFTSPPRFRTEKEILAMKNTIATKSENLIQNIKIALDIINKSYKPRKHPPRAFLVYPSKKTILEMEKTFAPVATKIYLKPPSQFTLDQQCFPKFIWLTLKTLEEAWSLKHLNVLRIVWPRIRVESDEIGLAAYSTYNKWLLIAASEDLNLLDKPNSSHRNFNRNEYMSLLSRLVLELRISLTIPASELSKKANLKHIRTPKKGSNEQIFCDWYEAWLEKQGHQNPHKKTHVKAILEFNKKSPKDFEKYQESTYKTWIRDFRKRKKARLSRSINLH